LLKVLIVGYGKMGEAFGEVFKNKANVRAYDIVKERLEAAKNRGIEPCVDLVKCVEDSDIVFLSVRPSDVESVSSSLKGISNKLLISIVAGWSTSKLAEYFPNFRIVRLMPNINVYVKHAVIALCRGPNATEDDVKLVKELLQDAGHVIEVSEKFMDILTILVGSGPALVAYLADALAWAAVRFGIDRETALRIVAHLLIGTGKHLLERKPDDIITMVATPGGVTIEALQYMDYEGAKGIIGEAIKAAVEKERRLA